MELPSILQGESVTRLLQGAIAGFLATTVIGFNWGGWMLDSTAKQMAEKSANSAIVTVLAPMCADKFRAASDSTLNMAELKKVSSWMQDSYIEKGGWATFSSETAPERGVASVLQHSGRASGHARRRGCPANVTRACSAQPVLHASVCRRFSRSEHVGRHLIKSIRRAPC